MRAAHTFARSCARGRGGSGRVGKHFVHLCVHDLTCRVRSSQPQTSTFDTQHSAVLRVSQGLWDCDHARTVYGNDYSPYSTNEGGGGGGTYVGAPNSSPRSRQRARLTVSGVSRWPRTQASHGGIRGMEA